MDNFLSCNVFLQSYLAACFNHGILFTGVRLNWTTFFIMCRKLGPCCILLPCVYSLYRRAPDLDNCSFMYRDFLAPSTVAFFYNVFLLFAGVRLTWATFPSCTGSSSLPSFSWVFYSLGPSWMIIPPSDTRGMRLCSYNFRRISIIFKKMSFPPRFDTVKFK
jgi:hypothetical protein